MSGGGTMPGARVTVNSEEAVGMVGTMTVCRYRHLVWHQEGEFPAPVAALVADHLAECVYCQVEAEGELVVASLVRRLPPTPAPPALRLRITAQLMTR